MKRKTLAIMVGAFVAVSAVACYTYAWPDCPSYDPLPPQWCPDGGGQVSYS